MVQAAPRSPRDYNRLAEDWRTTVLRMGRYLFVTGVSVPATYLGTCYLALLIYSVASPPITGVQLQRAVEGAFGVDPVERRYTPVPLHEIDVDLARAVVSGEDSRFFVHWGIDWTAIESAIEEYQSGEDLRGGSSITQQLVKNLFMTTHRSYIRKAFEVPLTYGAELLLSKQRILALYLNVIEWGPGVYGAEAAAQHYYGTSAQSLSRAQAAALAACIPNPQVRRPQTVAWYRDIILRRMDVLGPLPLEGSPSPRVNRAPPSSPAQPPQTDSLVRARDPAQTPALPESVHSTGPDSTRPPRPDTGTLTPAAPETLETDSIEIP